MNAARRDQPVDLHQQALFAPIRRRLVAWTMLILGAILVFLGTAVYLTTARDLLDQVDRSLISRGDQVMGAFGGGGPAGQGGHAPGGDGAGPGYGYGYRGGGFSVSLDANGQVLANPQQVALDGVLWPSATDHGALLATVSLDGEPARVLVRRAPDGDTLIVGQSLQSEQAAMRSLLVVLIGGGGLGLLLSLAGAWFLAGRALVPIQQAFVRQQEFVADASHELRTPLTVLTSATDLLHRYRADRLADHADLLDDVRAEVGRMQHLSEDLLTLARSDRGELQLLTAPVDLSELAAGVVRRMTPLADARAQTLSFAGLDEPVTVDVDPERIQQVLVILLDNAMKYTPVDGRIDVRMRCDGSTAVTVEVEDTGCGIAPEHLPRLFDRFYRADAARSHAVGGAGLGLSIANLLARAHGGELRLDSTPDVGTLVRLRLPLAGPVAPAR